jgi:hypothetical protein
MRDREIGRNLIFFSLLLDSECSLRPLVRFSETDPKFFKLSRIIMSSLLLKSLSRTTSVRSSSLVLHGNRPSTALRQLLKKQAFGSTAVFASSDTGLKDEPYVSELQDLFDRMERNGPTALGTTDFFSEKKYLSCGLPESALRFTTSSYGRLLQAPFVHPNEHRVVMTARTEGMSVTEKQILREIVGERFQDNSTLRLASNQFGSRIENKRHLVSMLDRIVLSCQRLAKEVEEEEEQEQEQPLL